MDQGDVSGRCLRRYQILEHSVAVSERPDFTGDQKGALRKSEKEVNECLSGVCSLLHQVKGRPSKTHRHGKLGMRSVQWKC